jgi:hypothetical protein
MGKLIQVGFKLAVLGVDELDPLGPWHVVRPGSFNVPVLGEKLVYARSLCQRYVLSNGYAADHEPKGPGLCPACSEQL